ncbi:D-aminoacyl-tRNA deacylase [Nitrosopumilus sp. K4]|uniref:D-aminoacyl-tRNA deacylase n=1 Tax=Nitrosopumilus sp. K4 TaxID=2795383 RepID=UPI001BAB883C|nr:D-aminoacyl-tRNA deacylase [Nitrosopumilus sp. K4]QUC64116.1 D-aminoacyl-tRNA deacylase [Nitrosopumilus sp. K4]
MDLLVAYRDDPAGYNMAKFLSEKMKKDGDIYRGENYDLIIIPTPAISADWLEEKYDYDGFVFLSKHAAESGVLALTCHSTGNFADAKFGGNKRQLAIPYPDLQKAYLQKLYENKEQFSEFDITIEATHHGPTALKKPCIFIEIGTTEKQWTDESLCVSVAKLVDDVMQTKLESNPVAICFGGTHYPEKFTKELLHGKHALGTVMPKHALDSLDDELFSHILGQNKTATVALLDWAGLGPNKQKVLDLLEKTDLEVIKL